MNYSYKVNTRKLELESCSDAWTALDEMSSGINTFLAGYDEAIRKVVVPVEVISPDQILTLVSIRDEVEKMQNKIRADLDELRKDV